MAEDLSNRSEWVDIFVATVHYQLGIEMQEAQELLYSVIAAIMSGDTLGQVLNCVAQYSKRQWSLETATELWMILSNLMLEFELPMLKGRSRIVYAKQQNCSPWSVGMVEVDTVSMMTKDYPMHLFSAEVQEWMYEAINFGEKICISQLLNYTKKHRICSEEYLYLLAEACITFEYTKDAEELIQQLMEGTSYGKSAAKHLKLRLQERYDVMDEEDDRMETTSWNQFLEAPILQPYVRNTPKIGRNDPCPCGSGKKYKKCCGRG